MIAVDLLCFARRSCRTTPALPRGSRRPCAIGCCTNRGRTPTPTPATGSDRQRSRPGTPPRHRHTPLQTRSTIELKIKLSAAMNHQGYLPPAAGMSRSVLKVSFSNAATRAHSATSSAASRPPAPRRSTVGRDRANRWSRTKLKRRPSMAYRGSLPRPWCDGRSRSAAIPRNVTPGVNAYRSTAWRQNLKEQG
jgi:hypothetical protein